MAFDKIIDSEINNHARLNFDVSPKSPHPSYGPLLHCTTPKMMEETNPELESFRQQWRAEVSARSQNDDNNRGPRSRTFNASSLKPLRNPPASRRVATNKRIPKTSEEEEDFVSQTFPDIDGPGDPEGQRGESSNAKTGSREPRSALEHYEKAVERETSGNLGDSLDLYRKAFRVSSEHVLVLRLSDGNSS